MVRRTLKIRYNNTPTVTNCITDPFNPLFGVRSRLRCHGCMDHTKQTTNDSGPYHLPQYGPATLLCNRYSRGKLTLPVKLQFCNVTNVSSIQRKTRGTALAARRNCQLLSDVTSDWLCVLYGKGFDGFP